MIERKDHNVELTSFIFYITDNEDVDSLVEVQNYSTEEAIEDAKIILRFLDAPSVITVYDSSKSNELRTLESEISEEDKKVIIIHDR